MAASCSLEEPGYKLVFEDDFSSGGIDPAKWDHEVTAWGGGNAEFEVYIPDEKNSFVKDGRLYLRPTLLKDNINPLTKEPFGPEFLKTGVLDLKKLYGRCTYEGDNGCYRVGADIPPIASARLRTAGRFSFKYGRVKFRAKMPGGDWQWPAVWLLPEWYEYGNWPMSGEVDIVEIFGNRDLKYPNGGIAGQQKATSTFMLGTAWNKLKVESNYQINENRSYADDFHNYQLDWSEEGFSFSVDGETILTYPKPPRGFFYEPGVPWGPNDHNPWAKGGLMAPFDQKFHLLLNVAVGGRGFPDDAINKGGAKPWKSWQSQTDGQAAFYSKIDDWIDTWKEKATDTEPTQAMQVDFIRVYQKA